KVRPSGTFAQRKGPRHTQPVLMVLRGIIFRIETADGLPDTPAPQDTQPDEVPPDQDPGGVGWDPGSLDDRPFVVDPLSMGVGQSDFGVALEVPHQHLDRVLAESVVLGQASEVTPPCVLKPSIESPGYAAVFLVSNDPHPAIPLGVALGDGGAIVGAGIVHN